ncbi:peptide chain release factor N(5)-glutamine methyltransferase [Candidatus Falkowbacteria bacterium]|nr:peptide chain release factor N(5)-glutamine methyltransferase [Candidatus Falkowbacteria bacterium]
MANKQPFVSSTNSELRATKTIKQLLREGANRLLKNKITSAYLDAEIILYSTLNKTREWLYANLNTKIVQALADKYYSLIGKRARHIPIAYITNRKEFFGLDFYVDKTVLIPRPETELLVKQTIAEARRDNFRQDDFKTNITIADIGTGSGCIVITLAKKLPQAKLIATDISKKALVIAKKNAKRHGVSSRINFFRGDLLKPVQNKIIDIIIANLPYLDSKMNNLLRSPDSQSLKFEPTIALKGGIDGLNLYRRLLKQISAMKDKPTLLLFEIGAGQAVEMKKIIRKLFKKSTIQIIKDLAGFDRVIKIKTH